MGARARGRGARGLVRWLAVVLVPSSAAVAVAPALERATAVRVVVVVGGVWDGGGATVVAGISLGV